MAKDHNANVAALQFMWLLTHETTYLNEFASRIRPEYFPNIVERYLVKFSIEHYNEYAQTLTESSLSKKLEENSDELDSLELDSDDFWTLIDELIPVRKREFRELWNDTEEFIKHQGLKLALREADKLINDDGPDAAWAYLDRARMGIQTTQMRTTRLMADLDTTMQRIGENEADLDYVPTGLPRLDGMMDGGLRTGEVAVFIAPTGRGKTMFLCQIAAMGLLMGHTDVVYYTLEVDRDEIFLRTLASGSAARINDLREYAIGGSDSESQRMRKAKANPGELIRKFRHNVRLTGGLNHDIFIRDVAIRGANLGTIMADFDRIRRDGNNPSLIIIDYADRLQPRGRFERRYEGQEEVFQELQAIAKEKNIAIWTASQAGRSGLHLQELTLEHIQGAFSKTFEASFVLAAGQSKGMQRTMNEEFYFFMAKARRSGGSGKGFFVKHDLAFSRFYADSRRRTDDEFEDDDDYADAMSYKHEEPLTKEGDVNESV